MFGAIGPFNNPSGKTGVCEEAHLYAALGYTFSDLSTSRA